MNLSEENVCLYFNKPLELICSRIVCSSSSKLEGTRSKKSTPRRGLSFDAKRLSAFYQHGGKGDVIMTEKYGKI